MRGLMRGLSYLLGPVTVLLAVAAGCVAPKSFGGTITGTVIGSDNQPATASVYLLDYERSGDDIYVDESASLSNQVTGRFRMEVPAGKYTLVASNGSEAAYADVVVRDGGTTDVGNLQLAVCNDPTSSAPVPCPEGDAAPNASPPPPQVVDHFIPDYTEVQRNNYPGYEELYVFSESYASGVRLEVMFPNPGTTPYGPGTYPLSPSGSGGIWSTVSYIDPNGGYSFFVVSTGHIVVDQYSAAQGGSFSARVQDAVYEWIDPATSAQSPENTVTIVSTEPLAGTVVVIDHP